MATRSQVLRKEQILSSLMETRQAILAEASRLSAAQGAQVFLGIWSVKDLLAHLIGWDETNIAAVKSISKGETPAFYEHRDHEWQTYNAILVKKHKKGSFKELMKTAKVSHQRLMEFLQTIPLEHFNKDFSVRFRGYRVTIQRLLEAELQDERIHLQQMTDFFKGSS